MQYLLSIYPGLKTKWFIVDKRRHGVTIWAISGHPEPPRLWIPKSFKGRLCLGTFGIPRFLMFLWLDLLWSTLAFLRSRFFSWIVTRSLQDVAESDRFSIQNQTELDSWCKHSFSRIFRATASSRFLKGIIPIGSMVLVYMLTFGVYWWDPWSTTYSSTMDPSWDMMYIVSF